MEKKQTGRIGQQFGQYILSNRIGIGSTAEVYLGKHIHIQKMQSAIKVLNISVEDKIHSRTFTREARILALLEHPYIVRLHEYGIEETIPYIAMTYAPNGDLNRRHPLGKPLPIETLLTYFSQIADAIQYAHDKKSMHLDLKPSNILISVNNSILVSDFGYARLRENTTQQATQTQAVTYLYSAPEQFRNKPCAASDQYTLGIIAYQWFCGRPPFEGSSEALMNMHLNEPPLSFKRRAPDAKIPQGVEEVLFKALAKAPEDRFEDVQHFAKALKEALGPMHVSRERVSPVRKAPTVEEQPMANVKVKNDPVTTQAPTTDTTRTTQDAKLSDTKGCAVFFVGIAILLAGFLLCPFGSLKGIVSAQNFLQQATITVKTQANNVSYMSGSEGGTTCDLYVSFTDNHGKHVTNLFVSGEEDIFGDDCPIASGEIVTLVYKPNQPDSAKLLLYAQNDPRRQTGLAITWVTLMLIGTIWAVVKVSSH